MIFESSIPVTFSLCTLSSVVQAHFIHTACTDLARIPKNIEHHDLSEISSDPGETEGLEVNVCVLIAPIIGQRQMKLVKDYT